MRLSSLLLSPPTKLSFYVCQLMFVLSRLFFWIRDILLRKFGLSPHLAIKIRAFVVNGHFLDLDLINVPFFHPSAKWPPFFFLSYLSILSIDLSIYILYLTGLSNFMLCFSDKLKFKINKLDHFVKVFKKGYFLKRGPKFGHLAKKH